MSDLGQLFLNCMCSPNSHLCSEGIKEHSMVFSYVFSYNYPESKLVPSSTLMLVHYIDSATWFSVKLIKSEIFDLRIASLRYALNDFCFKVI